MRREYFLILGSLLIAPVAAGAADGGAVQIAANERPFSLIPSEPAGRLTTIEARNLVVHWLQANGQRTVRIGTVVYDGGGNVLVDLITADGVLIRQILVDGRTHQIAGAKNRREDEG
jgi:hypothetical protein